MLDKEQRILMEMKSTNVINSTSSETQAELQSRRSQQYKSKLPHERKRQVDY